MGLMQRFKREIRSANGKQFAFDMQNGYGAVLGGLFERIARGKVLDSEVREIYGISDDDAEPTRVKVQAGPQLMPGAKAGKYTALISLHGVALYDLEFQPYCFSTLLLSQVMDQLAADPSIDQIVLDINTPGGHVTGTQEAADAVWAARKKKPVIGIVNPLCASAGYWIGSQCTKLIGVPSADIGSIGVFMTHYDCSAMMADSGIKPTFIYAGEHKVEGNSMEPLSEDARAWFQSEVDQTYSDFLAAVARGRNMSVDQVREKFGKGRCFGAPMAKRVGMIDEISPIRLALRGCGLTMEMPQDSGRRRGEAVTADPAAAGDPAPAEATYDPSKSLEVTQATREFLGLDADVEPMSEEGCGTQAFIESRAPGSITVSVAHPWPEKLAIAPVLLDGSMPVSIVGVAGDTITFAAANGAAVYTKVGMSAAGNWICRLEPDSSFSPIPAETTEPPAAGLTDAEHSSRRAAAVEAQRRRLALLSA